MSAIFEAGSVDRLLAVNVVYFLDPLKEYAAELYRIMAPGGRGLLACKFSSIEIGNDAVFINMDQPLIEGAFRAAGFSVTTEEIDLGNPDADYVAVSIEK